MKKFGRKVAQKHKKAAAPKVRFSFRRHILPPLMGIVLMVAVFGLLNLQYLTAQIGYRLAKPVSVSAAAIDTTSPDPGAGPMITIPKINVHAPIVINQPSTDPAKVALALQNGTLHYGPTAFPGEVGNVVIIGHSSGAAWRPGHYKWVFTLLGKLSTNDLIVVDYGGTRYIYQVTSTQVVSPTDLSVLSQTKDPELTLITCTPVGTNKNRLVVHAKQINPKAPSTSAAPKTTPITGVSLPQ